MSSTPVSRSRQKAFSGSKSEPLSSYAELSSYYQPKTFLSSSRLPEGESLSALAKAFYILIIIATIFFLVMLGSIIAVLVSFNNVVMYIAISSGIVFVLLLLLIVFIIGMKQFEKAYTQQIY